MIVVKRKNKRGVAHSVTALRASLAKTQGGLCAICKNRLLIKRGHQLDHDHKTGAVRGILCMSCNTGLGHFKDDAGLLLRAIHYLKQHAAQPSEWYIEHRVITKQVTVGDRTRLSNLSRFGKSDRFPIQPPPLAPTMEEEFEIIRAAI